MSSKCDMGIHRLSDMNLYEYNTWSSRLVIVSHANTLVRPPRISNEGMPTTLYNSIKNEAIDNVLGH
jgi:hypothetical protein